MTILPNIRVFVKGIRNYFSLCPNYEKEVEFSFSLFLFCKVNKIYYSPTTT